ncbi:MAG: hypothetical protein Q7W38_06860 [Deltaproteobacteria bacterium]|nr:hypothetical protein [Deltaproteobacteria bacterium]
MKEGAPAGKRSVAEPCLPSAKEGGIEGREGILGGSSALFIERITALCSRGIHPPVRAGQPLPGPGLPDQQKMNISLITTLTLNRFFF